MLTTKTEKKINKFQTALQYLGEYQGVKEAVIFDHEGLVIGTLSGKSVDAEAFSPLSLLIIEQTNAVLNRMNEAPVHTMALKTKDSWITIERVENLVLMVIANLQTDELLKVRIGQAIDMIKSYMKENYPLLTR